MVEKNCANCGTSNTVDATSCMVCNHTKFMREHLPVGDVDGPKPSESAETVVVIENVTIV